MPTQKEHAAVESHISDIERYCLCPPSQHSKQILAHLALCNSLPEKPFNFSYLVFSVPPLLFSISRPFYSSSPVIPSSPLPLLYLLSSPSSSLFYCPILHFSFFSHPVLAPLLFCLLVFHLVLSSSLLSLLLLFILTLYLLFHSPSFPSLSFPVPTLLLLSS